MIQRERLPAPWDPLRLSLQDRGTIVGTVHHRQPVCEISPAEKAAVIDALAQSLGVEPYVCENCGATRPLSWFKALGLPACCPDRSVVPTMQVLRERAELRRFAPKTGEVQLRFGPRMESFTENRHLEGVSARVGQNSSKNGQRLFLDFTKALRHKITAKRADVRPGTGDARGQLLITFGDFGAFKVGQQNDGRGGLILRVPSWLPDKAARPAASCTWSWRTQQAEMLVTLPADWMRAVKQAEGA